MAEDVLVEQNPNAGMLTPMGASIAEALGAVTAEGFGPNGIPSDLSADEVMNGPGTATSFADTPEGEVTDSEAGTEGGTTAAAGVNGSRARLPFNLEPSRTPVMGSWRSGTQQPAVLRSAWYRLPPRDEVGPLLVVSAAGRFDPGEVVVQWADDKGEPAGGVGFADVGRAGLAQSACPARRDPSRRHPGADRRHRRRPQPQHWIAVTPPRIPQLRTLQDVVGSQDPVLLDWLVGMAFPCQRPFGHQNGVVEVPKWRILPDRFGAEANSPVMDNLGGGPWASPNCCCAHDGADLFEGRLVPRLGRCSSSRRTTRTPNRHGWISVRQRVADSGARRR